MESSRVEWKQVYTEGLKKEIVAFANSEGGEILLGMANDGTILGVDNPDQVEIQVSDMIRDAISPDVSLFTRVTVEERSGRHLVRIAVNPGSKRPYYISKKGMTSAGVYVRQGSTSAPASSDAIRKMLRETDTYSYESSLSLDQDLSFEYCSQVFADKGMAFSRIQMQSMKMINSDGLYTNLAMLLSDQCIHTIQFAVFEGIEIESFSDRRRFSGSLLQQMDESYQVLSIYNRKRSEIHGLYRTDSRDYPEEALREALVNAIVHRDYDREVSTNIRVFDDRIELASYGGLPPNTSMQTLTAGLSIPRNRSLADIFYRLELIEAYGTGLPRMLNAYNKKGRSLEIKAVDSAFVIILPNLNYEAQAGNKKHRNGDMELRDVFVPPAPAGGRSAGPLSLDSERRQSAIQMMRSVGRVSRQDLEKLWGLKRSRASLYINDLIDDGIVVQVGSGPATHYVLKG